MTSYNKPAFVGKAIEGVLNQTFPDFELLIMDDNSNKETQKVIKGYLKDPRIQYFRSNVSSLKERAEKIRYAVLINYALTKIKGEYVSYATDDNIYCPDRLAKMVQFLDKNPGIMIVYSGSKVQYIDEENVLIDTIERPAKSKTWVAPCQVDHCSIMHRKSILPIIYEKWGSYWDEDPGFYLRGDARFFWRLNHFWPFYHINEVLDENYITATSLHTQMFSEEKSEFAKMLPEQRTCNELRDSLRKIRSGK
ncbi:glycosyltransferase family 2 protein [Alkaliphilus crotonatoxidans]